tara:strand:+ start:2855 stop:3262 length:408 start_codon:yes stop_codon:yes gene_type:complete
MADTTTIQIVEEVTELSVSNVNDISVTLIDDPTILTVNNFAIPVQFMDSGNVSFDGHGPITADNVRDAIQQLADQNFRTTETPTGPNIQEGDTWYDTDDDQLKVYRETSTGTFEWVPIIVGAAGDDSDTLDAGAF